MSERNPRKFSRRTFMAGTLALGLVIPGCSGSNSEPTNISLVTSAESSLPWAELSAKDRIISLESNTTPPEIDTRAEMVKAVTQFYSETLRTVQTPEELVQGVQFVSRDEMVLLIEHNSTRPLTLEEKNSIAVEQIESVPENDKKMYINIDALNDKADQMELTPTIMKDKRQLYLRTVLLHALGHVVQRHELLDVSGQMQYYDTQTQQVQTLPVESIANLELKVPNQDGEIVGIDGLDEALPDLIGKKLNQKIDGLTVTITPQYDTTSYALEAINRVSGVSDEQLYDYLQGKRPLGEYLDAISSVSANTTHPRAGALWSLYGIGSYFSGFNTMVDVDATGQRVPNPQYLANFLMDPQFGGLPLSPEQVALITG